MRKKLMAVLLAGLMVLGAGCGKESNVTLGEYKGLALTSVSQATLDEEIQTMLESFSELEEVDRAAVEGDTVNINFTGLKDGVAFEGGTDDSEAGTDLKLGSNQFIDGFEDGLIGAVAGEQRDLDLTFPENYSNTELAGQAVVFKVTVNAVKETVVPELTDAFVAENFPEYPTVAEYTTALRDSMNQQSYYQQINELLMANSEVKKYDEAEIETEKNGIMEYYTAYAESYGSYFGLDTATALQYFFGIASMEDLETFAEKYAYDLVKNTMILDEIAAVEKLELTDEEYTTRVAEYAKNYGYEDDIAGFEEQYDKEVIKEVLLNDFVMEWLVDQSVITDAE